MRGRTKVEKLWPLEDHLGLMARPLPWYRSLYYMALRAWDRVAPKTLYRVAKKFIQRGRRGWGDEDTWSLDDYLSGVLAGTLEYLANHTNSYPPAYGDFESWRTTLLELSKAFAKYNINETHEVSRGDFDVLDRLWRDLWD